MISSASLPNVSPSASAPTPPPSESAAVDRQPAIERMDQSSKSSDGQDGAKSGGGDIMEMLKKLLKPLEDMMSSLLKMMEGIAQSAMGMLK